MKRIILTLALSASFMSSYAQSIAPPTVTWNKQQGGATSFAAGAAVATDAAGNVYTTGVYGGTIDLDPGAGTFNVTSAGAGDAFISKFDPNGNFLWGKSVGGSSQENPLGIAVDPSNNVIIGGVFGSASADFDPGSGTFNLSSVGANDGFVLKLDANGNFLWALSMGEATNNEAVNAVSTDAAGNVYAVGYFNNTVDFDPGSGTNNMSSAGLEDAFIVKYTSTGTFAWSRKVGTPGNDRFLAIDVRTNGYCYAVGYYSGTIPVGELSSSFAIPGAGGNNGLLVQYDASGTVSNGAVMGSTGTEQMTAVAVDEAGGSLYLAGTYNTNIGSPWNLTAYGSTDMFILRLNLDNSNSATSVVWSFGTGNAQAQLATALDVDPSGNVYWGGTIAGSLVDFDVDTMGFIPLNSAGLNDGFLASYDSTGVMRFAYTIGNANQDNVGYRLKATNSDVYVTGSLSGTIDFDPGSGTSNMTALGSLDSYTVRYNTCETPTAPFSTTPTANLTICAGNTTSLSASGLPNGNISWYSAATGGTYLGSGSSFTTPVLSTTTTYYAQDSTCTGSSRAAVTVNVNQGPSSLSYTASATTICNGDAVTLSGSGANSYSWSGGILDGVSFNPGASGTYTLTGTALNGCTATTTASITVNPTPTLTITSTPSSATVCAGDSMILSGSGASSYAWSGGIADNTAFIPSASGTYTVTGTDINGCTSALTASVTVNALPTLTITSTPSSATVCAGDSIILSGSGASSYAWSGGIADNTAFIPSASGTYTVTGTDINGCTSALTASVTVNALPTVTASTTLDTVCSTFTPAVTLAGGGASLYVWTGGVTDGVPFIPTATNTYTVTGTDANGCSNTSSVQVVVEVCTDIISNDQANSISLYPNPTEGVFTIQSNAAGYVYILDVTGKEVMNQRIVNGTTIVDMNNEAKGMYFVRVVCENATSIHRLIVE